jgi:hypothetical protein
VNAGAYSDVAIDVHVPVDGADPKHTGLAIGGGVELAHHPVPIQDRQCEYPQRRLAAGLYT